ncbi:Clavaminate synthase [Seminavis robusta]|uniref:Clavaminate synthase n=1 Tax=Seminavis robusta TaxID=568900 RepID=A0A9N8ETA1_9STRA|nr:Clavaminate synthase [Seminavis robusta]|eukprot:Sro1758_g295700.1 Clavaminate synthase (297) ;mRNA; r:2198-3088
MPFDPKGPAAMVLRGLPIDPNVPPTPTTRETFFQQSRSCSCPVADTMVLGICRLLGILHGPKIPPQSHIVRDLMPTTKEGLGSLPMHRDYARQVGDQAGILWEPQFLILYCLRSGSARSQAATIVTDYQRLYQRISKNDRELLRKYKIQMKMQFKGTDDIRDLGGPFCSIEGGEENRNDLSITLHNGIPGATVWATSPDARETSEDMERRVVQACERLSDTAMELGEHVLLQPGDMLIINNSRCVHGRTAYTPQLDGKDRWFIKCYVSNGLWKAPGQPSCGGYGRPSTFPSLDYPQ